MEDYTPPQPTAEHNKLKEACGTWNVECEYFMDPSQPPMRQSATETVEMFGQFFANTLFESEMFGTPFKGRCTIGYEPQASRWVSTWHDTFSPNLYYLTGNYDATGEVLEMSGEGIDCNSGQPAKYRTVDKSIDPNKREFDMYMTLADGPEIPLFHYVYTRA